MLWGVQTGLERKLSGDDWMREDTVNLLAVHIQQERRQLRNSVCMSF